MTDNYFLGTRIVSAGRRWIKIYVRMSSTKNANMILAVSVILGPTLSLLNQLDTSVRSKNAQIEILCAVKR